MIKVGDKVCVLMVDDEYRSREGLVIEAPQMLAKVKFPDGTVRYYEEPDLLTKGGN